MLIEQLNSDFAVMRWKCADSRFLNVVPVETHHPPPPRIISSAATVSARSPARQILEEFDRMLFKWVKPLRLNWFKSASFVTCKAELHVL